MFEGPSKVESSGGCSEGIWTPELAFDQAGCHWGSSEFPIPSPLNFRRVLLCGGYEGREDMTLASCLVRE